MVSNTVKKKLNINLERKIFNYIVPAISNFFRYLCQINILYLSEKSFTGESLASKFQL